MCVCTPAHCPYRDNLFFSHVPTVIMQLSIYARISCFEGGKITAGENETSRLCPAAFVPHELFSRLIDPTLIEIRRFM